MIGNKRTYLFLQGPCSPLFSKIADELIAQGHKVYRISFNCGDLVYWLPKKSLIYRDKLSGLGDFMAYIWNKYGITDQVLFGNCRPVHQTGIDNARQFGIRTFVFECGYIRPYWITLEQDGVNGNSQLPKDPDWYRKVATKLPDSIDPINFKSKFTSQAIHDVIYHIVGIGNYLLTPHYKNHSPYDISTEYIGFIKRSLLINSIKSKENELINNLIVAKKPYYLLPLQLNSDAQITHYSHFENMTEVIETVLTSFAQFAPENTYLVIKNHPLDIGDCDYKKIISALEKKFDQVGRILYLETGDIRTLLKYTQGTVTVNSTTAGVSLELNRPTITLADCIFNIDGLTFQGTLDAFWNNLFPPDTSLYADFYKTILYASQINGGLYSQEGIALAAYHSAKVLSSDKTPLQLCYDLL